jgi:putative cardiolipin synthase
MGVIIASASLGQALARRIERDLTAANSWQVTVDDEGRLRWTSDAGQRGTQPARSFWQRIQNLVFKLAPASYY